MRVVLGEAPEPRPGPVQLALLGAGIKVVGQATDLSELRRVLMGVKPDAVVLDHHLGAMAVLTVREMAPASAVVVVWPEGVSGQMADETVEPANIFQELGPAIKRAVSRPIVPSALSASPAVTLRLLTADGVEPEELPGTEPVLVEPAAAAAAAAEPAPVRLHRDRSAVGRQLMPMLAAAASFLLLVVVALAYSGTPLTGNLGEGPQPAPSTGPVTPGGGGNPPTSPPSNPTLQVQPAAVSWLEDFFHGSAPIISAEPPTTTPTTPTPPGGGDGGSGSPPPSHSGGAPTGPPYGVAAHGTPPHHGRPSDPGDQGNDNGNPNNHGHKDQSGEHGNGHHNGNDNSKDHGHHYGNGNGNGHH